MTGDDRAYMIYLGLFLLFIGGSYMYSQRGKLTQSIQQALIWLLIFSGIIVAYGFKDTLTAQLYPNRAITDGSEMTFRKSRDGHFYALLEVNGVPIDFVVDTGATNLVLTREDAAKVGIDVDDLAFTGRAYTANGVTGSARVRLDQVRLGDIQDFDVRAAVNEGEMFSSLLGMDYLSRYGEIRITGDTLTLER